MKEKLLPNMAYKAERNTFYLVLSENGKRKWVSLGKDYAAALEKYAALTGSQPRPGGSFRELVAVYLKDPRYLDLQESSKVIYKYHLPYLLKTFGDAPVQEITAAAIYQYLTARSSVHAANKEKSVMAAVMAVGVNLGWLSDNPVPKVKLPPKRFGYKRRTRIITPAEWSALKLAATNDMLPCFMDLALMTGLRVSDVLALTWGQVSEAGLDVLQGKNKVHGLYQMTPELRAVLDRCKRMYSKSRKVERIIRPDMPIISRRDGKAYTRMGFRAIWNRNRKRAKCEDVNIHDIRRTAITLAKQSGRRAIEFSLHKTEAQANAYVVEVPMVQPLDPAVMG